MCGKRSYTQVELADKVGLIQTLVSDYERNKLRPHADIIVRFALALDVSSDELLGIQQPKKKQATGNRRFLRRLQQVDKLPKRDQDALLRTIDAFLAARKA
jgi:transcriptional regulator with XRE-family HTH domain